MPAVYAINDCETGGLDPRLHPLLSAAVLLADEKFNEVEGFAIKTLPPPNTWLEVPIVAHQVLDYGYGNRDIDFWLNVHDWSTTKYKPRDGWLITAGAVEKNGFVKIVDNKWYLNSVREWIENSVSLDDAEEIFVRWMVKYCVSPPIAVAHWAQFDTKFFERHLPKLFSRFAIIDPVVRQQCPELRTGWYCTCTALKKWNKTAQKPGDNAKLGTLAKLAGYEHKEAHEALDDTRACLAGLRWMRTGR